MVNINLFCKKLPKLSNFSDIKPIRHFDIDPEVESERLLSFRYAVDEINRKNVSGEVAEAGVMCGYFAHFINEAFPNKTLHLFDTFKGFDVSELNHDKNNGFLTNVYQYSMFDDNSIDRVKCILPYPDKSVFHIGTFESTCNEVKDIKFCFVSIDMDLYIPTLQALHFFYPRLSKGGYIFLHDYNHPEDFHGAKEALYQFESDINECINIVPLPDFSGTIVIVK